MQGQLTFPNTISLSPSMAGSRERADEQGEESQTSAGRVRAGQSTKNWYENTQTRFVSMRSSHSSKEFDGSREHAGNWILVNS